MARRRDEPRRLSAPAARPPAEREFSAGGLVYRRPGGVVTVVLAGRRVSQTGDLAWSLPKGHIEPGETSEIAAVREVREETGLKASIEARLGDVTYWYARRDAAGVVHRIWKRVRYFLLRFEGGRFAERDDEMDAVRWFPIAEAERAAAHDDERELIRQARARLEEAAS
jgi:8-oxo-dGTP pyrophosphatase MutT (NUDIX family)